MYSHPIKKNYPKYYPIEKENCKILILGSFPSKDLKQGEFYYGSQMNFFWHLMVYILEEKYNDSSGIDFSKICTNSKIDNYVRELTPEKKANLLLENNISLWDIVDKCTSTTGEWPSVDINIAMPILNYDKILDFLNEHRNIHTILFTGKSSKLKKDFAASLKKEHPNLEIYLLPSPTRRIISQSKYLKEWDEVFRAHHRSV